MSQLLTYFVNNRFAATAHQKPMLFGIFCTLFAINALANEPTTNQKTNQSTQQHVYTLRIAFSPANCYLEPRFANLRQCKEGFPFTVSGLRPEPLPQKSCSTTSANLAPLQQKVISRIMPDKVLRDVVWRRYGACTHMTSRNYFHLITKLAGQLNIPNELSTGDSYQVNKAQLIHRIVNKNSGLRESHFLLMCKNAKQMQSHVLTELQVCYDSAGKYTSCQLTLKQHCPMSFKIRGLP